MQGVVEDKNKTEKYKYEKWDEKYWWKKRDA